MLCAWKLLHKFPLNSSYKTHGQRLETGWNVFFKSESVLFLSSFVILPGLFLRSHHYMIVAHAHNHIQLHLSVLSLHQSYFWKKAFHLVKDKVTMLLKVLLVVENCYNFSSLIVPPKVLIFYNVNKIKWSLRKYELKPTTLIICGPKIYLTEEFKLY